MDFIIFVGLATASLSVSSKCSRQVVQAKSSTPCSSSCFKRFKTGEPSHARRTPVFQNIIPLGLSWLSPSNRRKLAISMEPSCSSPLPSPSDWIRNILCAKVNLPVVNFLINKKATVEKLRTIASGGIVQNALNSHKPPEITETEVLRAD